MITNPQRRKQIDDFLDKNYSEMEKYYQLADGRKITIKN